METWSDGYEVVLENSPSTAALITHQSHRISPFIQINRELFDVIRHCANASPLLLHKTNGFCHRRRRSSCRRPIVKQSRLHLVKSSSSLQEEIKVPQIGSIPKFTPAMQIRFVIPVCATPPVRVNSDQLPPMKEAALLPLPSRVIYGLD
ncbi:hypothetical protein SASPL_137665 [Salvia splendens]|uniref:Uncharacterized protein n=1 Tax=Salvia splendens TaxID=180675 RepID=A0A8X8WTU1_SALSN|nr:hypothetical protein SASPL_137665 [Salvia splendens]